jgi:ubiquinone/menaquinone biosynthesis C-methylase UbiE
MEKFWKLIWGIRANQEDMADSGGRSVRRDWEGQLALVHGDIKNRLNFNCDDQVLDIGCSGGMLIKGISPLVKKVTGVDYCINMINKAKERNKDCGNVEIVLAQADSLPFINNSFSKIICCSVFMYLGNFARVKAVINEMRRTAAHNAKILIVDILNKKRKPHFYSLMLLLYLKKKINGIQFLKESIGNCLGLHLWLEPEELKKYIEKLGMKVVVLEQNESLLFSQVMFDLLVEVNNN